MCLVSEQNVQTSVLTYYIIARWGPVPGSHHPDSRDGVHRHLWQGFRKVFNFRHGGLFLVQKRKKKAHNSNSVPCEQYTQIEPESWGNLILSSDQEFQSPLF